MGFSFYSLAVKGGTRDSVLSALGLRGSGTFEEVPESDITGTALPSGWYLIVVNRSVPPFADEKVLAHLSTSTDVVTGFVEEHVMCSSVEQWSGGHKIWSVLHAADTGGIEHLKTTGDLPSIFTSIENGLRSKQQAAGGNKVGVDYIFDIPVELIEKLTGYRHDRVMPELGVKPFEVLFTTQATPKRSWLRRLFGV